MIPEVIIERIALRVIFESQPAMALAALQSIHWKQFRRLRLIVIIPSVPVSMVTREVLRCGHMIPGDEKLFNAMEQVVGWLQRHNRQVVGRVIFN